jgi:hypothetical protein
MGSTLILFEKAHREGSNIKQRLNQTKLSDSFTIYCLHIYWTKVWRRILFVFQASWEATLRLNLGQNQQIKIELLCKAGRMTNDLKKVRQICLSYFYGG